MVQTDTADPENDRNFRFVELLGEHERQLNAFVLALVPSWADADDIVQQTRIRLWEQFSDFDETKNFGSWARTIAYFQVMTYRRQAGRLAQRLGEAVLEQIADTAASLTDSTDLRHVYLAECLEELSAENRNLLARCYGGNETIKAVAAQLGRSFNAVRQTLFRLRLRLFECVERKLAREEAS